MSFSFLSVCSGIEGASLALEPLGATCVGVAEIEKFPASVIAHRYGSNLPGEQLSHNAPPNFGDFTQLIDPASEARERLAGKTIDVLIGGTPCQAFSVAGKRLSLEDARGNLTLAFAVLAHELARSHGLRNVVWENVPGALNTKDNAFGCFLCALVGSERALPGPKGRGWPDAGMVDGPRARAAWRVLDAQYFGVPQRRARVFLVVDFGNGADPAEALFEPQSLRRDSAPRREAREGIAATLARGSGSGGGYRNDADTTENLITLTGEISHCLNAGGMGRQDYESETLIAHTVAFHASPNCGAWETGERIDALTTSTDKTQHVVAFDLRGREGGAQFEGPHETANIRAASGGSSRSYVAERWAVRRLTPVECERLQGAPDGWTDIPRGGKECPDGPRYAALGNSWAVPVVRWIGERLAAGLEARR